MSVLKEFISSIRNDLREAGVTDDDVLHNEMENIPFSVAAIVDCGRVMDLDDEPVFPVLTFANEPGATELVGAEGGSWMHEYVCGAVEEAFEDDESRHARLRLPRILKDGSLVNRFFSTARFGQVGGVPSGQRSSR